MSNPFRYFNSSPEVIRLVVMMCARYRLSLPNIEDLLAERGSTSAMRPCGFGGTVLTRCSPRRSEKSRWSNGVLRNRRCCPQKTLFAYILQLIPRWCRRRYINSVTRSLCHASDQRQRKIGVLMAQHSASLGVRPRANVDRNISTGHDGSQRHFSLVKVSRWAQF